MPVSIDRLRLNAHSHAHAHTMEPFGSQVRKAFTATRVMQGFKYVVGHELARQPYSFGNRFVRGIGCGSDVLWCRCHVQSRIGPELFIEADPKSHWIAANRLNQPSWTFTGQKNLCGICKPFRLSLSVSFRPDVVVAVAADVGETKSWGAVQRDGGRGEDAESHEFRGKSICVEGKR